MEKIKRFILEQRTTENYQFGLQLGTPESVLRAARLGLPLIVSDYWWFAKTV